MDREERGQAEGNEMGLSPGVGTEWWNGSVAHGRAEIRLLGSSQGFQVGNVSGEE